MSKSDSILSDPERNARSDERMVLVVPQKTIGLNDDDELNLVTLWIILWRSKWFVIVATALAVVLSAIYSLTATKWYHAEVLLASSAESSGSGLASQLGGLSGLASLAGINVGSSDDQEPMAVLRSRDFVREFIETNNLLPVLFPEQWDAKAGRWKPDIPQGPDIRDAVGFFIGKILQVSKDAETGLVTAAVEWTDPEVAADWANSLVSRLNDHMRRDALEEAEGNVAYLKEELGSTNVATLRQSIGNLLEAQLQKVMLARGKKEFAFRVIDSAQVPKRPVRPQPVLIVALGFIIAGMVSAFLVLMLHGVRRGMEGGKSAEDGMSSAQ